MEALQESLQGYIVSDFDLKKMATIHFFNIIRKILTNFLLLISHRTSKAKSWLIN